MKNLLQFILTAVVIFAFISCNSNNNLKEFNAELIDTIPNIESNNENLAIGLLLCYTSDIKGKLIICDMASGEIARYNSNSEKKVIFKFKGGQGPGDLVEPISMDTDSSGNIYIADMGLRRITKIDSAGNLKAILSIKMRPTQILVTKADEFLIIGFPNSYEGDLIQKYDMNSEIPKLTFGKRINTPESKIIDNCGETSKIAKDKKGNVYLASFFPYSISKFTPDGTLVKSFSLNPHYYRKPEKKNNMIITHSGLKDFVVLEENIILHCSYFNDFDKQKSEHFFDVIDLNEEKIIAEPKLSDFKGLDAVRFMNITNNSEVLFDLVSPDFHIKKYKVHLSK